MWASHSSCQQSSLTENSVYLCIVMDFFFLSWFLILLSTTKVCGRNHKAKLPSQSHAAARSDRSVSTLREKVHCATVTVLRSSLQLFISQQWGKNVGHCQDQPLLSIYPEGYAGL